ncbi:MAG: hypothetical protein WCN97_05785 [Thermoleophilia bacterium]
MQTLLARRGLAALTVIALAVGAALPTLGSAASALIGTSQLANGAVTNAKVRAGSLKYGVFAKGQVARADLKGIKAHGALTGTYPSPGLASGSVKAGQIATGAVGKSEIAAGAVGSDELAAGAVRASDIADGSIGASKIAANSIGAAQIQEGGVGSSEIRSGAVGVNELAATPGARAYRSAPITLASGVLTTIPLTDVDFNRNDVWATSRPASFVAPVAGIYIATASVVFQSNGSGTRSLWIAPAGAPNDPYNGEQQSAVTEGGQSGELTVTAILRLGANEAVSMVARQNSGTDLQVLGLGERTSFSLQFVSP